VAPEHGGAHHPAPRASSPGSALPRTDGAQQEHHRWPSKRAVSGSHAGARAAAAPVARQTAERAGDGQQYSPQPQHATIASPQPQHDGIMAAPWFGAPRAQPNPVSAEQLRQAVQLVALYHQQQQRQQQQAHQQAQEQAQQAAQQAQQARQLLLQRHQQQLTQQAQQAQPGAAQQDAPQHHPQSFAAHLARAAEQQWQPLRHDKAAAGSSAPGSRALGVSAGPADNWEAVTAAALQRLASNSRPAAPSAAAHHHPPAPQDMASASSHTLDPSAVQRLLGQLPAHAWSPELQRETLEHEARGHGDTAPAAFAPWRAPIADAADISHAEDWQRHLGIGDQAHGAVDGVHGEGSESARRAPAGTLQPQHARACGAAARAPTSAGWQGAPAAAASWRSSPEAACWAGQMHHLRPAAAAILEAMSADADRAHQLHTAATPGGGAAQVPLGDAADALWRHGSGGVIIGAGHGSGVAKPAESADHAQLAALLARIVRAQQSAAQRAQHTIVPQSRASEATGQGRVLREHGAAAPQHSSAPSKCGAASALAG
jgi:hypothetical protein